MAIEQTSQGVRKNYGPRFTEDKVPSRHSTAGSIKEIVVDFNYDDLPSRNTDDNLVLTIPANAFLLEAFFYVTEAFDSTSGTTELDVGLVDADGGANDPDGIFDAVVTADGSTEPAGTWVVAAGNLIGGSVSEEEQYITVNEAVGDLEAGAGRLIVRYIDPKA